MSIDRAVSASSNVRPPFAANALPGGDTAIRMRLDQQKPDNNKPVMDSQKAWLAGEAAKLGKTVAALSSSDIVTIARQGNAPGPSEIERIRDSVVTSESFKIDQQKPDNNTPVMDSQKAWLAGEVAKLGKTVAALSSSDIVTIARQGNAPGPSEIERIQAAAVAAPVRSEFISGSTTSTNALRPATTSSGGAFGSVLGARMQTQADMNIQAGKTMREAQMNLAAAESAERFGRTGPLRQLQEAEGEAFEHYATAAADFAASAYQGGSLAPLERASALTDLFTQRTTLVQGRNVEGVVAGGSSAGTGLQTQQGINQDAGITLRGAQAELASVTDRVRLRLADSPRAALFEASCRAFDGYAAAASETAGFRVKGGSLEPLARAGATESLVRERTALLEQTLEALSR